MTRARIGHQRPLSVKHVVEPKEVPSGREMTDAKWAADHVECTGRPGTC